MDAPNNLRSSARQLQHSTKLATATLQQVQRLRRLPNLCLMGQNLSYNSDVCIQCIARGRKSHFDRKNLLAIESHFWYSKRLLLCLLSRSAFGPH